MKRRCPRVVPPDACVPWRNAGPCNCPSLLWTVHRDLARGVEKGPPGWPARLIFVRDVVAPRLTFRAPAFGGLVVAGKMGFSMKCCLARAWVMISTTA